MGWSEAVAAQCHGALTSNFPLSPFEYDPAFQGESRIHPVRKRLGVTIIILDKDTEILGNLIEKQRIFNESVAKFA